MRAHFLLLVLATGLAACSERAAEPADDAKKELAMIEKAGGSKLEICQAHRKIADAYLKAQDEENYKFAKAAVDSYCTSAKFPD